MDYSTDAQRINPSTYVCFIMSIRNDSADCVYYAKQALLVVLLKFVGFGIRSRLLLCSHKWSRHAARARGLGSNDRR